MDELNPGTLNSLILEGTNQSGADGEKSESDCETLSLFKDFDFIANLSPRSSYANLSEILGCLEKGELKDDIDKFYSSVSPISFIDNGLYNEDYDSLSYICSTESDEERENNKLEVMSTNELNKQDTYILQKIKSLFDLDLNSLNEEIRKSWELYEKSGNGNSNNKGSNKLVATNRQLANRRSAAKKKAKNILHSSVLEHLLRSSTKEKENKIEESSTNKLSKEDPSLLQDIKKLLGLDLLLGFVSSVSNEVRENWDAYKKHEKENKPEEKSPELKGKRGNVSDPQKRRRERNSTSAQKNRLKAKLRLSFLEHAVECLNEQLSKKHELEDSPVEESTKKPKLNGCHPGNNR